jgi:hypothetical protein
MLLIRVKCVWSKNAERRGLPLIEDKGNNTWDDMHKNQFCVGPLNLNRQTKQAGTVMGTELSLDSNEFDALDMLAAQEGEPLAFELIYSAVWDTGDGSCNRDTARVSLDKLIDQVDEAGEGFMKIEHKPETGYTFQTRWGHNWKKQHSFIDPNQKKMKLPLSKQRRYSRRKAGALLVKMTIAAACVATIAFSPLFDEQSPDTYYYFFDDIPVPLAAMPDFGSNIIFPSIDDVIILDDDSRDIAIEIYNDEGNPCWFVFEIVLEDTGEVVYTSEFLAPGTRVETVTLTMSFEKSEYNVILNIRAYDFNDLTVIDEMSTSFTIFVS